MNILIPTIGSRGDVQPFIALAQGLIGAGHKVTLASHPMMRSLVESHRVAFAPIGPDIDLGQEVEDIRRGAGNVAVGLMRGMGFAFRILEQSHDDILARCAGVDLIVVPAQSATGKNEADKLNLPYLSVNFMPWGIPWKDPERPWYKRLIYGALDQSIALITTRPLNQIRKRQGLPPVDPEGFTSPRLDLIPVSPAVYEPNPNWAPHHHMTGYWFAEAPKDWQPTTSLLTFLDEGEPPVVVSLGAMGLGKGDALETARLFVDSIRMAGIRAIIQSWEGEMKQMDLPPNVYTAGSLPHSWLLPHCAGMVHHGGFGSTSAAFRAGIPALVIPHLIDQFYWGQRVFELGVGPQPIQRKKLDTAVLLAGFRELVSNSHMQSNASALGEKIRAENGIQNAVGLIKETFLEDNYLRPPKEIQD